MMDDIDKLFAEIEIENRAFNNAVNIDKIPQNFSTTVSIYENELIAKNFKLFELTTLKKWDKIPSVDKNKMLTEPNVRITESMLSGIMIVPFEMRKQTTAKFFLFRLKQEGVFVDLHSTSIFRDELKGDCYLLCITVSRRMSEKALLTGNYLFKLMNDYKESELDSTLKSGECQDNDKNVCKKTTEGLRVMHEKCIFLNFFFDIIQHSAADPLMVVAL